MSCWRFIICCDGKSTCRYTTFVIDWNRIDWSVLLHFVIVWLVFCLFLSKDLLFISKCLGSEIVCINFSWLRPSWDLNRAITKERCLTCLVMVRELVSDIYLTVSDANAEFSDENKGVSLVKIGHSDCFFDCFAVS